MKLDPELAVMAELVLERFRASRKHIATVESCTGGLLAAVFTSIAGSSDVFDRAFITYSNDAKEKMVGVSPQTLEMHGAVSPQTALEMASGGLSQSDADAVVSITGIAGPGGGSPEKPVGLVFVAVAANGEEGAYVEEFRFGNRGRDEIRNETVKMAMEMLLAYGLDDEGS